ncbi:sensor histidine kinase [Pseudomarimonas arenosa]|uniref:histidine kinase n=1 Tax=Pseudomarimonas arenosa TaxID=2774145 RepID=A0AAW3ZKX1_9GAMM|nr:HAMP domain-containing sensor histidine kinase [Pseudomarimonas arenosa]MBD8525834.1 HAMP domain-containing histidine kinase [Pseudomarimonas arenosa]
MSLSLRLTLALAALIVGLALAALLGLRALTADLRQALGQTVTEVSHSLVTVLDFDQREEQRVIERPEAGAGQESTLQREMRVVVNGRELNAEEIAAMKAEGRLLTPELQHFSFQPGEDEPGKVHVEFKRALNSDDAALWLHRADGGALAIPISGSPTEAAVERFSRHLWLGFVAFLLVGIGLAALIARRVTAPLRQLAAAAERVGHGALGEQLAAQGPSEVQRSIEAFNRMSRDLAQLQQQQERRRDQRELAELGEIGRGLAHSLRNPLHALGLSLDALRQQVGDDQQGERLGAQGREQLARIDQALRGFLALSASTDAQPESVRVGEIIDDVLLEASQRAQGRVQWRRDVDDCQLRAVAVEVRIMLQALVVNALEASPDGATVSIRAGRQGQSVLIEVDDEGPGLNESIRQRLFQPHVSSKPSGAGMGLFLAERLARRRYRGEIQLLSREGRGIRAQLRLHDRQADQEPLHAPE